MALNSHFIDKIKAHIENTLKNLDKENIRDNQPRWEYLKYEITKLSIKFSKLLSKNTKTETLLLEKTLKLLERSANYLDNSKYVSCKSKVDQFYKKKLNSIRIRSKCDWYKYSGKSTKLFLNLAKIRAHQNKINILKNGKGITDQQKVNNELFDFYNNSFKSDKRSFKYDITQFSSSI